MATVTFYEKPGCINNTKQKAVLTAAGHRLDVRNLLTEPWTPETLRPFFGDRPVVEWFNLTAPQIKSGEIIPAHCAADTALKLMVQFPLLIRRPLIQVGDRQTAGFDLKQMEQWIESDEIRTRWMHQDLQTCPRTQESHPCELPMT